VGIIGKRVGRGNRKKTNFGHTLHVSACHASYRDAKRATVTAAKERNITIDARRGNSLEVVGAGAVLAFKS
jgi:hypothetical protein